jgi:tRNA (mo5U34)-methyltransferase
METMPPDNASDAFAYVQTWHEALDQIGWWHSFELPGGRVIEGVSTLAAQKMRIAQFPIPEDLRGKRVLDVGTWDGWFAMEMERRGADVVAIDRWENPRFFEIRDLLGSRVDYRQLSVYDLDPDEIGRFDIVLFMGVLYHLKHPLLALEKVCSVAKDLVAVESFVLKDRHRPGLGVEAHPLMEFYEGTEFGGEFDNWVAPTVPCLLGFCRTAGFARVELNHVHDFGAAVSCHRTWSPAARATPPGASLKLVGAFHTDSGGINFRSTSSDDYVGCRVEADGAELTLDSVQPEVGGYGSRPVFVGAVEGHWQVNFKLPPGLSSGWHAVRLRTPDAESNAIEIAVDVPVRAESLEIRSVCDGVNWRPFEIAKQSGFASIWAHGLPRNADRNNVKVSIAGKRQITTFVGAVGPDGTTQVNVQLRPGLPEGKQEIGLRFGDSASAVAVEITP